MKSIIMRFNIYFIDLFEKIIQDCDTILDLGCGTNSPLRRIKKRKKYSLGVDIFKNSIEISKKKKIHDDYLHINIMNIDEKISEKSFDCVLLIEVIEHLEKFDVINLIRKVEKIAKKKVLISTPNGFLQQDHYSDNIYQVHKSGWDYKSLKKINYRIYGYNGLKLIRGEMGRIKYNPKKLWQRFSTISNLVVRHFPQFAFQLLCVKEL